MPDPSHSHPSDSAAPGPALDALRESEERFRTVFMQAPLPQGLATIGDWRLVAANEQFLELTGFSAMELVTRTLVDVTHPDDWPRNLRVLQEMLDEGGSRVIDKRYVRPDGAIRHVRNHLQIVRDDHGQPRYVHAVTVDLTPLHHAQEALSDADARLRLLLEDSHDLLVVVGPDGSVRSASDNCAALAPRLTGRGASLLDLVEPAGASALRDALAEALLRHTRHTLRIRGREGCDVRHWDLRLRGDGEQGVVVLLSDVTERVVADQIAEGESALMRRLLDGEPRLDVLDGLARLMEDVFPGLLVTVMLIAEGGSRMVYGAAPSMPPAFVEATNGLPISLEVDAPGRVTFYDEPVIIEDLWTDPVAADYRHLLQGAGLRSCWSRPIHASGDRQVGVMTMFGAVPGRPEPRQWRLAQRLANLAGIIIAGSGERENVIIESAAARAPEALSALTDREADVLRLVAFGYTNQEIADELYLSVRTVEAHRSALHRKLRTKRRADLVRAALSGGLLDN